MSLPDIIANFRLSCGAICEVYGYSIKRDYEFVTGFYKTTEDLKDKFWLTELTVKYHDILEKDLIELGFELDQYYHNDGKPDYMIIDKSFREKKTIKKLMISGKWVKMARYKYKHSIEEAGDLDLNEWL